MKPDGQADLVRAAEQIADGVAVDWDARLHETPALDRSLAGLRSLEALVSAHRALLEGAPARAAQTSSNAGARLDAPPRPRVRPRRARAGPPEEAGTSRGRWGRRLRITVVASYTVPPGL